MKNNLIKLTLKEDLHIEDNWIRKGSVIYIKNKDIERLNFYEMSNFRTNDTGLPVNIFLSLKGNAKHGLRVKVQNDYSNNFKSGNLFSIAVKKNNEYEIIGDTGKLKQKDIDKVIEYIKLNLDVIQDYWDDKLSSKELYDNLKKLGE